MPGSLYERDGEHIYNTAIAVSPAGEIVAKYRKVFPWQPYENTTPGSEFVVFDIPGKGRIGLAICYDGSFPETARQLAWLGAEVVLQPTLTSTRDREMELVCARANSWTNQMFTVNLNGADPWAVGASVIVDPEGVIRQQAGSGEEIMVETIDLDMVTKVRTYGTCGLNRPWQQLARYGSDIRLPMYGGGMKTPDWLDDGDGRLLSRWRLPGWFPGSLQCFEDDGHRRRDSSAFQLRGADVTTRVLIDDRNLDAPRRCHRFAG